MDWQALYVSLKLATVTSLSLFPIGMALAYWLNRTQFKGRYFVEALLTLPLVLPPTVLGYFLLVSMDSQHVLGGFFAQLTGQQLAFSFTGLWLASIIYSLPFAVQPILRAMEQVPDNLREAAWCSGISRWKTFLRIEMPLIWPGIMTAWILSFCHTLGEFGVVLMIGGNIAGETRTLSIAIYDSVIAFEHQQATVMSLILLGISVVTVTLVYSLNRLKYRVVR
ncbi:molybdate ABC transporter inner membrane subunit [Methylophaga lonarensis MPL]|uniref:Molybdenum transport system permease n=1 Tax=Methylophaga lonarensis MPL TaxID=1286106 RepID=M7NZV1_9GAMM|nr:molybdate ABC transporter permease subunit [Methylophaga lonarensis]EMR12746.1 molybdate ABC transporter inner membrane subunit [Methylophaga lonarensis MPL]